MQYELKKGKSKSEIVVFLNADHGFHAGYRAQFNKPASEEAWQKLQDWFEKNGAI
ncbi:MAG: dienelactone hydrolase family protein [Pyrinomonadaceae bacterium]|jgi:carboxymethylenebutenolidase